MDFIISKIKGFTDKLTKLQKIAFLSTIIAGVLAHGYGMANSYIYHDATILNGLGITYGIGRWVLGFAEAINKEVLGNYNLPFLNIALSIFYIAVASMVTVKVLKVKKSFTAAFIGAIMIVHPTVQSSFAYNFTASYYAFALMLSAFAADIIIESVKLTPALKDASAGDLKSKIKVDWKKYIIGILLITVYCATYQTYLCVTSCLFISSMVINLLDEDEKAIDVLKKGLLYLGSLVAGLAIYLVINTITNAIVKPYIVEYQGGTDLGKLSFLAIPKAVLNAYLHFFYIKWNGINVSKPMWGFLIAFLILAAVVIVKRVFTKKTELINKLFIIGLFLIFPLAVNLVYLMSTNEYYNVHTLMRYGTVFVFILPVVLIENDRNLLTNTAELLVTALAICYIFADNAAYTKMDLVEEEMNAYFAVLESRITSTEGYADDLDVVFVGAQNIEDKNLTKLSETYPNTQILGYEYNAGDLINKESWLRYMRIHAGFEPTVGVMTQDILDTGDYWMMGNYPDDNSIKVINGRVVVKFSEEY